MLTDKMKVQQALANRLSKMYEYKYANHYQNQNLSVYL